jgi:hypothetical protein
MRKLIAAITVGVALVAAPAASAQGEPAPGCKRFGHEVADTVTGFGGRNFGQTVSFFARESGNPLRADRVLFCP